MTCQSTVLITREKEGAERFAGLLSSTDLRIHILPFFEVEQLTPIWPDVSRIDAVLTTSGHAVPALETCSALKEKPCHVVGAFTAERLCSAGFQKMAHIAPDAERLNQHLLQIQQPLSILYARGEQISFDFTSSLGNAGVTIHEVFCYRLTHGTPDPLKLRAALTPSAGVLLPLFSEQTAQHVCDTITHHEAKACSHITAIAMSERIAESVAHFDFKSVVCSDAPDLQSLADKVMLQASMK